MLLLEEKWAVTSRGPAGSFGEAISPGTTVHSYDRQEIRHGFLPHRKGMKATVWQGRTAAEEQGRERKHIWIHTVLQTSGSGVL